MPSQHADDQARFLLFATTDIWREGGFAYGGVLWAPTGLDRDGPVLKLMMVAADASVSSIGPSYNVRLATGIRAFDAFYVGPEVQAFGADSNYQQLRAGLQSLDCAPGQWNGRPAPASRGTLTTTAAPTASSAS